MWSTPYSVWASITSSQDEKIAKFERFLWPSALPAHRLFKAEEEKTAAGILPLANHEGNLYVLLGKRNDHPEWCNFGGGSKSDESYLNETAAQELLEESCGLYAVDPDALHASFSHTVQTPELTYRMYIRQFQYLDSLHFLDRLNEAKDGSSKEYTDFAWFKLRALINWAKDTTYKLSLQDFHPQDQQRFSSNFDNEMFSLFGPFATMMREQSVLKILTSGNRHRNVHTFRRLERGEESSETFTVRVGWYPVQTTVQDTEGLKPSDAAYLVPYGRNAVGNIFAEKTYEKIEDGTVIDSLSFPVLFNPEAERKTVATTVVKKAHTLMELISLPKFEKGEDAPEPSPIPEKWKVLVEEFRKATPTERHLKWVLKNQFLEGRTLEAYRGNFRAYLEAMNNQSRMENRGKIDITDEAIDQLATLLHQEVEALQHPIDPRFPLYHGAVGQIGELYTIFSYLKEILRINPLKGAHLANPHFSSVEMNPIFLNGVRGTDMYFQKFLEILKKPENQNLTHAQAFYKEFIKDNSSPNYDPFVVLNRICANPALTCGPGLSTSTSNSIEYWLKGHSVTLPPIENIFPETLALLGTKGEFTAFNSIFTQYYGLLKENETNGVMFQMFVSPALLNVATHSYNHHCTETYVDDPILGPFNNIFQYEKFFQVGIDPSKDSSFAYPEIWAYFTPDQTQHDLRILSYRKNDLPSAQHKQLISSLKDLVDHMTIRWLTQRTRLMDGALYEGNPTLYKLHRMVSLYHAGESTQDSLPQGSLEHLINLGNVQGVETFITHHPEVIDALPEKYCHDLLLGAIYEGNDEMATLLSKTFYNQENYVELLTEKEAILIVQFMLNNAENPKTAFDLNILHKLNEKFSLQDFSKRYMKMWLGGNFNPQGFSNHLEKIESLVDFFGDDFIFYLVKSITLCGTQYPLLIKKLAEPTIKAKIKNPVFLRKWFDAIDLEHQQSKPSFGSEVINIFKTLEIDPTILYKEKPLINYLIENMQIDILSSHPAVTTFQNSTGKNIRQLMEEDILLGNIFSLGWPRLGAPPGLINLSSNFNFLNDSIMKNSSQGIYEGLQGVYPPYRSQIMEFLDKWYFYEKHIHEQYWQRGASLTDSDRFKELTAELERLEPYGVMKFFRMMISFKPPLLDSLRENYADNWNKDEDILKDKLKQACIDNDLNTLEIVTTDPKWRYLFLPTLATAFKNKSLESVVFLFQNYPARLPFDSSSIYDLDKSQVFIGYNAMSDTFPNWIEDILCKMPPEKGKKIVESLRSLYPSLHTLKTEEKNLLINYFSPQDIFNMKPFNSQESLGYGLIVSGNIEAQDRLWVEKLVPFFREKSSSGVPYGVYILLNTVMHNSFDSFKDLLKPEWILEPLYSDISVLDMLKRQGPSLQEKFSAFLKEHGLMEYIAGNL